MKNNYLSTLSHLATGLSISLALVACTLPEDDESPVSSDELTVTTPFCDTLHQIFGTPTPSAPAVLFDLPGRPANFLPDLRGALLSDRGYIAFTSITCGSEDSVTLTGRQLTVTGKPAGITATGSTFVWNLHPRAPGSMFLDVGVEELRTGETIPRQSSVFGLLFPDLLTLIPRGAADSLYPQPCTAANPARGCWYEVGDQFHGTAQQLTSRQTSFSVFTFSDSGVLQTLLSVPDSSATLDPS
jgi:hypothetical protein